MATAQPGDRVRIHYATDPEASGLQWLEPAQTAGDSPFLYTQAQAIHEAVISIDTHVDIGGNYATPEVDPLDARWRQRRADRAESPSMRSSTSGRWMSTSAACARL